MDDGTFGYHDARRVRIVCASKLSWEQMYGNEDRIEMVRNHLE